MTHLRTVAAIVTLVLLAAGCGSGAQRASEAGEPTPTADIAGGWWATWHDVTVEVPADWTWDWAPAQPECVRPDKAYAGVTHVPGHPYVAIDSTHEMVAGVACSPFPSAAPAAFGPLPFQVWQPYVVFADPHGIGAQPDGTWTYRGWTLTRRTAGGVQVAVLVEPGDDPATILDTEHVLGLDEEDAQGCPPSDPVQSVGFVRPPAPSSRPSGTTGMTSVSICQYDRADGERAGLIAERRLTGAAATGLLEGIDAAPAGGGPDQPQDCDHTMSGDTALLLRTHFGADYHQDAYVYYDWCFGNGVVTPDGTKQLTTADCRPLFGEDPIELWQGQQPVFERCAKDFGG